MGVVCGEAFECVRSFLVKIFNLRLGWEIE